MRRSWSFEGVTARSVGVGRGAGRERWQWAVVVGLAVELAVGVDHGTGQWAVAVAWMPSPGALVRMGSCSAGAGRQE